MVVDELEERKDHERAQRIKIETGKAQKDKKLGMLFGKKLDFFSKELVRKNEELRLVQMATKATEERKSREEMEKQKRVKEEELLKKREEILNSIDKVYRRSAMIFVDDLIGRSIVDVSNQTELPRHQPTSSGNSLISKLLSANVVSNVEEGLLRKKLGIEQQKFKIGVEKALESLNI
ncbi:hypothetical protein GEMRC1_000221 [Eukaryota sp. GEM-RC1]